MTEFATAAELEVSVADGSLSDVKRTISDALADARGAVEVSPVFRTDQLQDQIDDARGEVNTELDIVPTVTDPTGGGGGGGPSNDTPAPDGGAGMGLSETLSEARQTNAALDDNLGLNETRNEILRDILDTLEAQQGGGDGFLPRLPNLGSILSGLGGLGAAVAAIVASQLANVDVSQLITDAIPSFVADDIVDPVAMTASDLIAGAGAIITAPSLIANKLTVEASDLIAEKAEIAASEVLELIEDATGQSQGDPAESPASDPAAMVSTTTAIDPAGAETGGTAGQAGSFFDTGSVGLVEGRETFAERGRATGQTAAESAAAARTSLTDNIITDNPIKALGGLAAGGAAIGLAGLTGGASLPLGGTAAAGLLGGGALAAGAAGSAAATQTRGPRPTDVPQRAQSVDVQNTTEMNVTVDVSGLRDIRREMRREADRAKEEAVDEAVNRVERKLSRSGL